MTLNDKRRYGSIQILSFPKINKTSDLVIEEEKKIKFQLLCCGIIEPSNLTTNLMKEKKIVLTCLFCCHASVCYNSRVTQKIEILFEPDGR